MILNSFLNISGIALLLCLVFFGSTEAVAQQKDSETDSTLCDSIRQLPYYNDFNSLVYDPYDFTHPFVDCWTRICTYDTADVSNNPIYPQRCDDGLNNSVALCWFWYSGNDKQTIVLPPVAAEVGSLSGLRLLFKAKHNYYICYPRFVLGVMSDPDDYSTFVPVDSVLITHNYYEDFELSLAGYNGNGRYVALHLSESGQPTDIYNAKYVYLDNLILADENLCHQPLNIQTHPFHNRVELTWSAAGDEAMWRVRCGALDTLVVTSEITIEGLQPLSTYSVEITSICGSENYGIPLSIEVNTFCPMTDVPYDYGFEEYALPSCWIRSSGTYPMRFGSGNASWPPHSGNASMMLQRSNSNCYLVLPLFSTPLDSLELSLWLYNDSLEVGMMTNPYNMSSFTSIRTVSVGQEHVYEQFHFYFPASSDAEQYLTIRAPRATYDWKFLIVDDVEVDYAPTCKSPDSWRLLSCDAISATMQWYGYGCGLYRIDCTPDDGSPTVTAYSQTEMATVTGLEPSTTYNVTVRAICGDGDTSLACGGVLTTTTQDYTPCEGVYNLQVDSSSYSSASFSWAASFPTSDSLLFRVTVSDAENAVSEMFTHSTELTVTGLQPSTSYVCSVQNVCDSAWGHYSEPTEISFSTDTLLCSAPDMISQSDVDCTSVALCPNPAKERVSIKLTDVKGKVQITLLGIGGNKILQKTVNCDAGGCTTWLDIRELPVGPYFVKVSGNKVNRVFKLVKK